MKLYKARSKLKHFYELGRRYSNVDVFCVSAGDLLPDRFNSQYIKDYKPGCGSEHAISELLTAEEVKTLRQWLKTNGENCIIEEVALPISKDHYSSHICMCNDPNVPYSIFTLPGASSLKVMVYSDNLSYTNRAPMAHDFFIASPDIALDENCFYCNKEVTDKTHYRILVALDCYHEGEKNIWIYGRLCDDCSVTHAPELYLSLQQSGMPLLDFPYAEDFNTYVSTVYNELDRFGIEFTEKYDTVDRRCAMCQTSVSPIFPYSIKGMSGQVLHDPLCMKCSEVHVPQLFKIFKQVCASGADQFLRGFEKERNSMEYGIFKDKFLSENHTQVVSDNTECPIK